MTDVFRLDRFVEAQAPVYERVLDELRAGRKRSHWMWFVFPQIAGLGHSPTAVFYAIGSLAEAQAYLAHPLLGSRLRECTDLVNRVVGRSATAILGQPDDLKFHASATLFARASSDNDVFQTALDRYFEGRPHEATLARLA